MFKHTISELKEALVCLQAGQVTLKYPFQPHPPDENFRGKPVIDFLSCIGCGACANACPPRLIILRDMDGYRQITFELGRCTYCGSCRDVCPEHAISMSTQFETATPSLDDMILRLKLKLVRCRICGQVVATQRIVNKVVNILTESGHEKSQTMNVDLCLHCKRKQALTPVFVQEVNA